MKKRDLTDKDRLSIIDYINAGLSTPEIMKKMRNLYSHQQIAALRAWKTMNSPDYGGPVKSEDLKTLTEAHRNKIIGLVRGGLTTPRIMKRLRDRYTRQQIAAVRAHVKMGTYL